MISRRTKRVLLGVVIVPLASAVGVEVGARLVDRMRGKPWSAEATRAAIEEVCSQLSPRAFTPGEEDENAPPTEVGARLHPYTGWEHPSTRKLIEKDAELYRDVSSESAYDICILGGSVAHSFSWAGEKRLVLGLRKDPRFAAREVRIHAYAAGGFKQLQQQMQLAYLLMLGHRPDAVIELDGFNEAALGWANARAGMHPLYPSVSHWSKVANVLDAGGDQVEELYAVRASQTRARSFGERILSSGWWRSCFLGHVASLRLERLRRRYVDDFRRMQERAEVELEDDPRRGPAFAGDDGAIGELIAKGWEEASVNLHALCKERGITYLHVLQPTLHDRGSKPLTQKEVDGAGADSDWIEGVEKVYPRLREAGARLSKRGVPFLDSTRIFRERTEDLYIDACHFDPVGNRILADAVAPALLEAAR